MALRQNKAMPASLPGTQTVQPSLFDDWEPAACPPAQPAVEPAAVTASPLVPGAARLVTLNPAPTGTGLVLGQQWVTYQLRRSRRRSIGFMVGPDGLSVNAPRWVGTPEIEAVLRDRANWILRKLVEQRERGARVAAAKVAWGDGAGIPFLGDTVIVVLDPRVTAAQLRRGEEGLPGVPQHLLHLGLPHTAQPEQIRDTVQSWLQRQARRVFEERCEHFAKQLGVHIKRLSLSSAGTRWGSASADGSIRLNWRLIHFRMPIIDYVVAHELAHLREMNHSAAFWEVVRTVVPQYQQARDALRREVLPGLD
jgi:predicted metal-dependent hydrolase